MFREIRREAKKFHICSNQFFMIFFGGFCLGIILVNFIAKKYLSEVGIFGDYFLMQFKALDINKQSLFIYVFEKRIGFLLILFALGFTSIGCACSYIFVGWFGFSAGMLLSLAAREQGVIGVLICFMGVMPQFIVYVPVGYLFLKKMYRISSQFHNQTISAGFDRTAKRQMIFSYFLVLLFTASLFFVGILLESYINPVILKKVLTML